MSFPTTDSQDELQAVNQILASVGQAPVTTLEQTNPDVAIAYNTLKQVAREIQSEGWTFNKEYNYPLTPDAAGEILIPANMLQIDMSVDYVYNRDKDPVPRQGKLYDRTSHSYVWQQQTMYFDITWLFDWSDIPAVVRDYITARAASFVAMRIVGDPNLYQILSQQEAYMRATAMEWDTQQGDYTFFGHERGSNYYRPYKPFHALYR
jgi:hypothetical protein